MPLLVLKQLRVALSLRFASLGISARLAIACGAVLLLVLAMTFFARESSRRAAEQVALIRSQHEPLARLAQSMLEAAAAVNQATLELANPEATPDGKRITKNLQALSGHAASYLALIPTAGELVEQYLDEVAKHELRTRELLVLADRRRTLIRDYWKSFSSFDRRMDVHEQSLRSAGHASSPSLSQALGRLQDSFGSYASAGGKETARAVTDGEVGFRNALDANSIALLKAIGANEVAAVNAQFETLIRMRRSIVAVNNLIAAAHARFVATGAELSSFIDTNISVPARNALAAAAIDANAVASKADQTLLKLGVATLLVLLLISAATAYGVLIPVRKLLVAIKGIAQGQRSSRVRHYGGIYELDSLGRAFNEMAEQLEHAEELVKHYQGELEQRIDERTRQLQYLSHHDPVTHLPNRRQLMSHLDATLQRAASAGSRVGVLFLDLDHFKTVNDTLGHEVGDRLLKVVADRLTESIDARTFVARLGGDEFTIVRELDPQGESLESIADSVVQRLQRGFELGDREVVLSASIGAAVYPDHAGDTASLLRAGDAAVFQAKQAGRNRHAMFRPELLVAASSSFQLEQALRRAIEYGEFELFYQPQVDAETLQIVSVEALIRWRRADGEMVAPLQFLGAAERCGLMKDITNWVLVAAIQQVATWRRNDWPDARVAINVSSQQLLDAAFLVRLEATLEHHAVPPQALEIELTESALQNEQGTFEALHWLRSFGVAVALDDFGTGYSSLTSIEQLPLTRVKIDRSLIRDIDSNVRYAALVRSIVSLCRSLDLAVTTEGVERGSQLQQLRACAGIDVQGYFLAKPMPVASFDQFRNNFPPQELVNLSISTSLDMTDTGTFVRAAAR